MWENILEPSMPETKTWRMRVPFWVLKATNTHLHYAILAAAPPQQWLHERFLILLLRTLPVLVTYLLTPWCRVLLEQLTGLQLIKKFPAFHGTPRFIAELTSVRHLSLSWASPIQSISPNPTSWRSILILSTHLRLGLPSGHFPSSFPNKTL